MWLLEFILEPIIHCHHDWPVACAWNLFNSRCLLIMSSFWGSLQFSPGLPTARSRAQRQNLIPPSCHLHVCTCCLI